jgi:hypothetical protein
VCVFSPYRNRFPDMTTEWLALWVHFLWSGLLAMVFSVVVWYQIGSLLRPSILRPSVSVLLKSLSSAIRSRWRRPHQHTLQPGVSPEVERKRRRLLQIGVMVSVCLLLNVVATLVISEKLHEWSRTSKILLACHKETPLIRNWEAYGFNENIITKACTREETIPIQGYASCSSDCYWHPVHATLGLVLKCVPANFGFESIDEYMTSLVTTGNFPNVCDCPCSNLIEVEKPRYKSFHLYGVY